MADSIGSSYFPTLRREPYLVAYYRLNDSSLPFANDSGPFGLDGVYNSTPTTPGPALIQGDLSSKSCLFNANSQNISVGDVAQLRLIGDLAIETWLAPFTATQTTHLIQKMDSTGAIPGPYLLSLVNGAVSFFQGNGTTSTSITGPVLPLGVPIHIVATSFRGALSLYVNGVLSQSGSLGAQAVVDKGQSVLIGGRASGTSVRGLMSEVAIYNGALSARRIARHFTVGQNILSDQAHYTTFDPPVVS